MIQLIIAAALFVWGIVTVTNDHPIWGGLIILLALLVAGMRVVVNERR